MLCDVEMHDAPAIVADDKEAVEDAEADRGHGEEVHGRNRFPVIRKKYAPALGWGISRNALHPAGDGFLGDIKAPHEQFMHARRAPQVGFSAIIRKISSRTSVDRFFLP